MKTEVVTSPAPSQPAIVDLTTPMVTTVRILAFDPGITEMGWSVVDFEPLTGKSHVVAAGTLHGQKLVKTDKELKAYFQKPFCVLMAYQKICMDLIRKYKPAHVVSESAFNFRFPQVLVSLTLVIHTIRCAAKDIMMRDIHTVAPMETKKEVAGYHMADKEQIKSSIIAYEGLTFAEGIDKKEMTEHEYDATGHAICFAKRYLPDILAVPKATSV